MQGLALDLTGLCDHSGSTRQAPRRTHGRPWLPAADKERVYDGHMTYLQDPCGNFAFLWRCGSLGGAGAAWGAGL